MNDEVAINMMKELLLLMARPARLLECLEDKPLQDEPVRLDLFAKSHHIPTYILSKITAHFGPEGADAQPDTAEMDRFVV